MINCYMRVFIGSIGFQVVEQYQKDLSLFSYFRGTRTRELITTTIPDTLMMIIIYYAPAFYRICQGSYVSIDCTAVHLRSLKIKDRGQLPGVR